jgi:hypothetical protein
MVEYGRIIAYLTLIILIFIFGYTQIVSSREPINQITPSHELITQITLSPDPIIGGWGYHENLNSGMEAHIQFYSDGTYFQSIKYCQENSCRGLLPIQGKWKKEGDGKYHLTRDDIVQLWNYSSSENCIYNEADKNLEYCR